MSGVSQGAVGLGALVVMPIIAVGAVASVGIEIGKSIAEERKRRHEEEEAAAALLMKSGILSDLADVISENEKQNRISFCQADEKLHKILVNSTGEMEKLFTDKSILARADAQNQIDRIGNKMKEEILVFRDSLKKSTDITYSAILSKTGQMISDADNELKEKVEAFQKHEEQEESRYRRKSEKLSEDVKALLQHASRMGVDCSLYTKMLSFPSHYNQEMIYSVLKLAAIEIASAICQKENELSELDILKSSVAVAYEKALETANRMSVQRLKTDTGESEFDTDMWSRGKFSSLLEEAKAALNKVSDPQTKQSELEELLFSAESFMSRILGETQNAALNFLLAYGRAYNANSISERLENEGWNEVDRVYSEDDVRNELYLKYENSSGDEIVVELGTSTRDEMLNAVKVHCFEDGRIDEAARQRLLRDVSRALGAEQSISCVHGTENTVSPNAQVRDFDGHRMRRGVD